MSGMSDLPGDAGDVGEGGDDGARGRTFLVTGGNTGIGRSTAAELAGRGGRVYIACRSAAAGEAAVAAIKATSGSQQVWLLPLDLSSLASVRSCAAAFLALDEPLHVLVNNAGVGGQRGLTADGFELHFGVNHLGHYALTLLLLDRLTASRARRQDRERVERGALRGAGHRLRRPPAAHAVVHRAARVRGLETVQRAVHAGAHAAGPGPVCRPTRCTPAWSPPTSGVGFPGSCDR